MKKEIVIKSCYSLLRRKTPLKSDCGKICNGKCCAGDEKTGMIIFPGEEDMIDENMKIFKNSAGYSVAVCNGSCDRNKRPLACRIYPLFPLHVSEDGETLIKTVFDYRADCPLCQGGYEFDKGFIKAVRRVGKFLLLNEETAEVYRKLSSEFDEYYELMEKFGKS